MAGATEIVQLTKGAGEFQDRRRIVEATIALDASLSTAVDLQGCRLVAIVMSAGWDTAGMTFQASVDGSTWINVHDDAGNEQALVVAGSRYWVILAPSEWESIRHLKIRSGTSGTPVAQTAERVIELVVVPV